MSVKKRKTSRNKPHGHYCRICGEHKANEKFSGRGHAAHICKACAGLSPAARSEAETLNKIGGMAFRHLSESEIKWLRNRMKDSRPEVREAAREAHNIKFPHYERNQIKKGMTAFSLDLFIHDEIVSDWGDWVDVHVRMVLESNGKLRRIDYDAPEGVAQENEIDIGAHDARRFLKSMIHEYDALFWGEDFRESHDSYEPDEDDADETDPESPAAEEAREPIWTVEMELSDGNFLNLAFYEEIPDAPVEIFWALNEFFEDDLDEGEI